MTTWTREAIEARAKALGPWFHNMELRGVPTAPDHFLGDYPGVKFRGFAEVLPADLSGKTVLDIGCNGGFYSIEMKRRGAARVLGIDFDEDYLRHFPTALVRAPTRDGGDRTGGEIVAFANLWTGAGMRELSMDLMRYAPGAPESVMEYLFLQLMLWGKAQGYEEFNLGMAPLSGFESRSLAPLWIRAGALVYQHGGNFYNFQGLRRYKEKFDPVWVPRYLASPGGLALPRILANVTALISGGLKGVVAR